MAFTDEQQAIIEKWMAEKWTNPRICPLCGEDEWNVADTVFSLSGVNEKGEEIWGAPIYPVVIFTCNTCGNVVLVNALKIGILKRPEPVAEDIP